MRDTAVVGQLRPSQILFTYGVGASVELPQMSTMVLGLDEWPRDHGLLVSEARLPTAVRSRLGHQVAELRTPPREHEHSPTAIGVPVAPFPEWLRCPVCNCSRRSAAACSNSSRIATAPNARDLSTSATPKGCRQPPTQLDSRWPAATGTSTSSHGASSSTAASHAQ